MCSRIEPLLVLSLGRSGSTHLMEVLGTSPHVEFDRVYPYERRYLTHWCQCCRVIGMASDKRFNYTDAESASIGPIPFPESAFLDRQSYAGELLSAGWSAFSRHVRRTTGNERVTYYAEKTPYHIAKFLDGRIDYRFIVLLRDPRDVFLSIKSFNEKRQKKSFGWQEGQSDVDFARHFCLRVKTSFGWARRARKATNGMVLRYEDLIENPSESHRLIGEFLQADVTSPSGDGTFRVHGTSKSPADSVGGWHARLAPQIAGLLTESLAVDLNEFGYGGH